MTTRAYTRQRDAALTLAALRRQLDAAPIGTLREVRLAQAFSIRELAAAANVSPATVVRLEAGHHPHPRTRRQIATALNVPPSAIEWGASPISPTTPLPPPQGTSA